jgi:3'-phosphoadenosine 5'-phosphosulfate sulfotransferase (PAPS reductase)/FAD synthetase
MKITLDIIDMAMEASKKACIAFSGGNDSILLMDIIFRHTKYKPIVIFSNSQMEYPETEDFCKEICKNYNAEFHIAKAEKTPIEQWQKKGWPMMGKMAARIWMQKHKDREFGFKMDVTACCLAMKIAPARKLMKELDCDMQFTGTKGNADDILRGMRAIKDGSIYYAKYDKITVCNPLTSWTDTMSKRYRDKYNLPEHPAKKRGAMTIGCVCCGGGSQFSISAYKLLRKTWPEAWRYYIIDLKMGEIILSIKYNEPLEKIQNAINDLGGLEKIANERPWIFDFTREKPLQGYDK